MAIQDPYWDMIHTRGSPRGLPRRAAVTARPDGALRFQCPITGSFVVVTDDRTLAALGRPGARLHCPSCGEMHRLA